MKSSNLISVLAQTTAEFGAKRPAVFLQMMVVCAGLALLLSTAAIAGDKSDKEALIDCINGTFDSLESDKQKNEVHLDYQLTWYVHGVKDAVVRIEFVTKGAYPQCKAESPFPSSSFVKSMKKDYGFEKIESGKVDKRATDLVCYAYKISCSKPDGSLGHTIDPIIEVPKP